MLGSKLEKLALLETIDELRADNNKVESKLAQATDQLSEGILIVNDYETQIKGYKKQLADKDQSLGK